MIYAYVYLCVGVLILIAVLADHHLQTRNKERGFSDPVDDLHPERKKFKYALYDKILVPALAGLLILVAWPIAGVMMLRIKFSKKAETSFDPEAFREKKFAVSASSRVRKCTVDEIERLEVIDDPLGATPRDPFGHLNSRWKKFKSEVAKESEIWSFSEKWKPSWDPEEIRSGYVELNHGEVGAFFIKSIEPAGNIDSQISFHS